VRYAIYGAPIDHGTGSKRTIDRQDQFLVEFRRTMVFRYHRMNRYLPSKNPHEDTMDDTLFNEDQETLTKDIIFAIQRWMQTAVTRRTADTRPKISGATLRRQVLLFWVIEKRRDTDRIFYKKMFRLITKGKVFSQVW
jgi:hypothetical protein